MKAELRKEIEAFLASYTREWQKLDYATNLADWAANTKIVEGDDANEKAKIAAKQTEADFTGSEVNVTGAQKWLKFKDKLTMLQAKQLERVLYLAADNPQTVPELVKERIGAETSQLKKLYGFNYTIDGRQVSTNQIDEILRQSNDLSKRLKAWEASKAVGRSLKDGLAELQRLRNATVQALGYQNYNNYKMSEYGESDEALLASLEQINKELRPLYRELHTYARYELAKRYGAPVPDMLPAHWLPNRWGQDWSSMVEVKGLDLDSALKAKTAEWVVQQAEDMYVSLGWPRLPQSFWDNSSLYPLPPDSPYKKNNHASAWHLDSDKDIRSLMSVEPNAEWFETAHHELGHIYYFMSYSRPEVPILLRVGANRAFHEAIGTLMELASRQQPYLVSRGLVPRGEKVDEIQALLKEALNYVVFIPFSTGTMTHFEYELYARNLPKEQFNKCWWDLARKYQGIVPPTTRGEEFCDASSKTHITDDPGEYYDYALSTVLLFQLHDHIAKKILHQDVHATNYYGNKEVGAWLDSIMSQGGACDWRAVLKDKLGEDVSAKAMLEYFAPLTQYLKQVNAGRQCTLPEL